MRSLASGGAIRPIPSIRVKPGATMAWASTQSVLGLVVALSIPAVASNEEPFTERGLVVVVASLALLVAAALQLRAGPLPFPAIITAALTSSLCYTVGGATADESSAPSIPIVMGSLVGVLALIAMVVSLVPRSPDADRDRRAPLVIAAAGTVVGALGLLFHQFA